MIRSHGYVHAMTGSSRLESRGRRSRRKPPPMAYGPRTRSGGATLGHPQAPASCTASVTAESVATSATSCVLDTELHPAQPVSASVNPTVRARLWIAQILIASITTTPSAPLKSCSYAEHKCATLLPKLSRSRNCVAARSSQRSRTPPHQFRTIPANFLHPIRPLHAMERALGIPRSLTPTG